jgi:hypothetical protein
MAGPGKRNRQTGINGGSLAGNRNRFSRFRRHHGCNGFPSTAVQPDTYLYTIADLSTVWVNAQVFQSDLARVKIDAAAAITLDTYPGRALSGRVDFLYADVVSPLPHGRCSAMRGT